MRFARYINEEYYKRYYDTEIYVNPDSKELLKAFGKGAELRWMTNYKKKLLYVWRGRYIHMEVADKYKELLVHCLARGASILDTNGRLAIPQGLDDITTKPGLGKPIYKNALDYLKPYFNGPIVEKIFQSYHHDVETYGEEWLEQWWED